MLRDESPIIGSETFELAEILRGSWPELSADARRSGLVGEGEPGQAPAAFSPDAAPAQGATPPAGGQGAPAAGDGGAAPDAGGLDPRVLEHMNGLQQQVQEWAPTIEQLGEALPQLQQLAAAQVPGEPDPLQQYAEAFAEQLAGGQAGEGDEDTQQQIAAGLQQMLSQVVGPLQEKIASLEGTVGQVQSHHTSARIDALVNELPGLQDPEQRVEYAKAVADRAAALARPLGPQAEGVYNALLQSPEFLKLAYFAQMGEKGAASETPAGGAVQGVLESAGGASAVAGGGQDEGDSIVAAGGSGGWNP